MKNKFIKLEGECSVKELIKLYHKHKKLRLKMAYELKFVYGEELDDLKALILKKQKELEHMAAEAQYDRENADGLAYNEVTLNIH